MQLGIVGLGRMGGNIARRLMRAGHRTVVHDRNREAIIGLEGEGAQGAHDLGALVQKLKAPRAVWVVNRPTPPRKPPAPCTCTAARASAGTRPTT